MIKIRRASTDDLKRLAEIHASHQEITPMQLAKLTLIPGRMLYAIDFGGHAVGLLLLQLSTEDARIIRLVIDPAFRRRGIGRSVIAWCRSKLTGKRRWLIAHMPAPNQEQVEFLFAVGFFCCAVHGGKHKSFTYTLEASEVQA